MHPIPLELREALIVLQELPFDMGHVIDERIEGDLDIADFPPKGAKPGGYVSLNESRTLVDRASS